MQRKKLIEVALPLDAVNTASAREKSIRHGHPSTLHLWWARRPLAAARAVIFAQMVDDPSSWPELFPTEKAQEKERKRLFAIIEDLVKWENTTNEKVLQAARDEIWVSWRRTCAENADHPRAKELFDRQKLPAFHDPFAGGGSLPLEAQRLGLEAYASDLNPVAVLINKAMIEIPPKFAGRPPVNPEWQAKSEEEKKLTSWRGAQGLAEDVRYYGKWMRDEAEKRIGHLYPKIAITAEMAKDRKDLKPYVGQELTVIAWLWARTVKSPNPAYADVDVPLASTFMLSTKPGKETYVEPVTGGDGAGGTPAHPGYRFTVKVGKPKDAEGAKNGTKLARGANFRCVMSGTPIGGDYIKAEGKAGRMGARLMAIVAEGERSRIYLAPTPEHEAIARKAKPEWRPEGDVPPRLTGGTCVPYGLATWGDLFTPRQLVALTTFSDLVQEARDRVQDNALGARASRPPIVPPHPGWHSRRYHPHFDRPGLVQSVTFRLHDSVPGSLLQRWREELGIAAGNAGDEKRLAKLRERLDEYEDAGHGACHLRNPRIAEIVEKALLHFDGERYRLLEWCVMPNHVHVLVEIVEQHALKDVVHSWKSFTAKEANRVLARSEAFWMEDYYDRFVRDEAHLAAVRNYIRENPVKAGLCGKAEDWRWSSAGTTTTGATTGAGGTPAHPGEPLREGGAGARAYAEAVGVYLAFCLDKGTITNTTQATWQKDPDRLTQGFSRQAIPMIWDYAEANPLSEAGGGFGITSHAVGKVLERLPLSPSAGTVSQQDAATSGLSVNRMVSSDPPYYDNIGYADLSDFFYVWLRRSLRTTFPDLFATLAVPKAEELVATPYRHGSKEKAESFFLNGMTQAMHRLAEQSHPACPVTIYYAFKQSETLGARASGPPGAAETAAHPEVASTGWDTFLAAVIRAGFAISGTWPIRTELIANLKKGSNALASSIILVCRPRSADAPTASRREFITALRSELPSALAHLQRANIAPVDLAQAAIGPGMGVFTRYARVLDAEGKPLPVRDALALINQTLDEVLAEQEGDFDEDTRWALAWFDHVGFDPGDFGVAETLSKAKNTSIAGLVEAGILQSKGGKVRLLPPDELPADWDPATDTRLTIWEVVHHLIRVLETGGESAAAQLVGKLGAKAEVSRELAYRLYTTCDRKKRAQHALAYNGLVQSWPELLRLAQEGPAASRPKERTLFDQDEPE